MGGGCPWAAGKDGDSLSSLGVSGCQPLSPLGCCQMQPLRPQGSQLPSLGEMAGGEAQPRGRWRQTPTGCPKGPGLVGGCVWVGSVLGRPVMDGA